MATVKQYIEKQRKLLTDIKRFTIPFKAVVTSTIADQGRRIFSEGKKTSGAPIGQYNSTTPLYVNTEKKSPKKVAAKGKHGETNFNDGKPHVTTYFSSYKDYRRTIGRPVDKMNLVLSGDLQLDFFNQRTPSGPVSATRVSDTEYQVRLKRDINVKKVKGQEAKRGPITKLSKSERAAHFASLKFNFTKALRDA
jgi:hypothetical protein